MKKQKNYWLQFQKTTKHQNVTWLRRFNSGTPPQFLDLGGNHFVYKNSVSRTNYVRHIYVQQVNQSV